MADDVAFHDAGDARLIRIYEVNDGYEVLAAPLGRS